jgi:TrmH family RNA methyltransferase
MMSPMPSPALPVLTSIANPRVRAALALRDRRERDRTGLTLVDGARELRRALDAGATVVEAFVCEPLLAGSDARAALDQLRAAGTVLQAASEAVFAKLAFGQRAEGLVAVVRIPALGLDHLVLPERPLVIVVESVEKPGNLGAILRSADGAGADAVIAASPRTDPFNPNAIRASAGTIFSVPLGAATTAETLAWLAERGLRTVTARVDAERSYADADLTGPLALVLGAEAEGLSDAWRGTGIEAVRIPMLGVADSLNVSVSAAILLYEARRQRERPAADDQRPAATRT